MPKTLQTTGSGGIDFESFLSSNATTGEIRNKHDARVVLLTADTLLALVDAVRERLGAEVGGLLYGAGQTWGRRSFAEFAGEAEQPGQVLYHVRNMGIEQFKDRFNDLLVTSGWGTFTIEERFETVLVHVNNSAFHEMVSSTDQSYTDLFSGFLAGFFSELIGVELSAVQICGFGNALDACSFLLADEAIVATVRRWIQDGKSCDQVLEMLQSGHHQNETPNRRT